MTIPEAISFLRPAIKLPEGLWADIGAGTGVFTQALMGILRSGSMYAVDKSPHALYSIQPPPHIRYEIVEADFNLPLSLPLCDGIIMANALHYAPDHVSALRNVLDCLQPNGAFVLIEYDTDIPNNPWVPNPVSKNRFHELCLKTGLSHPEILGSRTSVYGHQELYLALTTRNPDFKVL
jgi:SAM-dependent methyltransferase